MESHSLICFFIHMTSISSHLFLEEHIYIYILLQIDLDYKFSSHVHYMKISSFVISWLITIPFSSLLKLRKSVSNRRNFPSNFTKLSTLLPSTFSHPEKIASKFQDKRVWMNQLEPHSSIQRSKTRPSLSIQIQPRDWTRRVNDITDCPLFPHR